MDIHSITLTQMVLLSLCILRGLSEDGPDNESYSEDDFMDFQEDDWEEPEYTVVEGYDPDDPSAGMGTMNMASMKPGQCPNIICQPLKKPKPCPEAKPEKVVVNWQGLECEGCPFKWDKNSCTGTKESGDTKSTKQKMKTQEL